MRVLVITFTFPPARHANAKRPQQVVNAMIDAGWDVEVWTSRIGMVPGDAEIATHERCRVIRLPDPVSSLASMFGRGGRWERLITLLANGLLWPDSCRLWARRVLRSARGEQHRFDRVLAFVFPPSILLGGDMDGVVDRKWVFDMQESVSPQYALHPRRSRLQRWLTPRLARAERATLHKAGRVLFTAETNRRAYIDAGLADAKSTRHIPFFHDAGAFAERRIPRPGFEIGYFGNFDLRGHRNPATFLRSLAGFLAEHPEAREKTRFVFHGDWLPHHDELLDDLNLRDVSHLHVTVAFNEYLEKVRTSPILLLVAAAEHNLFMPSKVVEYLGAGRPVLAFVPQDSEVAGVLRQAGMADFICEVADVDQGILTIERLWQRYLANDLSPESMKTEEWSSTRQIPRYLDLLRESLPEG